MDEWGVEYILVIKKEKKAQNKLLLVLFHIPNHITPELFCFALFPFQSGSLYAFFSFCCLGTHLNINCIYALLCQCVHGIFSILTIRTKFFFMYVRHYSATQSNFSVCIIYLLPTAEWVLRVHTLYMYFDSGRTSWSRRRTREWLTECSHPF